MDNIEADVDEIVRMFESPEDRSARLSKVMSFSESIKKKKYAAIAARKQSGIEEVWQECENAYEGVDEYNQKSGSQYVKGRTMSAGLTERKKAPPGRSTVIPNITRPYVDAASARMSDMLLPTDEKNWGLENTPVDDATEMQAMIGQDAQTPGVVQRIGSAITGMFGQQQQKMPAAKPQKTAVDRAIETIADWHTECRYNGEVRKVIESAARIGVGILKGPHPTKRKSRKVLNKGGAWAVEVETKVIPASLYVSAWNFYPDYPACGNDIQRGSFVFERDDITAKALSDLRGGELDYIDEMIDMCLEEGPTFGDKDGRREDYKASDTDLFEIWYYYGHVSKDDMEAAGCEYEHDYEPCVVTMVNDRIIKIALSVLDTGEFPFDVMVWQDRLDHWAGQGVGEQIGTCQKSLTAAVRALQDNMALSSGPQIIVDSSKVVPADGNWVMTPRKLWRKSPEAEDIDDVRSAFSIVSIETRQVELLNIINYWTKTAEDVTGLPMLLQGGVGSAPDTATGVTIVNNNGSTVLRRIVRTFDDKVTEPHIGRYYEYLLLHGPDDAKGDFIVKTRGSSALIERETQKREMMQLLGASLNPAYEVNPAKVMGEVLKSMRFDPDNVGYTEEEKAEMAQRQQQEDPRISAAKIMAKSREDALAGNAQIRMAEMQAEQRNADLDRELEHWQTEIDATLEAAKLDGSKAMNADQLKTKLADTNAKLMTQIRLTMRPQGGPQMLAPPMEPPGRAPNGQSWPR